MIRKAYTHVLTYAPVVNSDEDFRRFAAAAAKVLLTWFTAWPEAREAFDGTGDVPADSVIRILTSSLADEEKMRILTERWTARKGVVVYAGFKDVLCVLQDPVNDDSIGINRISNGTDRCPAANLLSLAVCALAESMLPSVSLGTTENSDVINAALALIRKAGFSV